MKRIPLTRGCYAIVDDRFAGRVLQAGKWQCHHGYADREFTITPLQTRTIGMHRFICELAGIDIKGKQVDHRNGNRLDNRLRNLRPTNHSGNCRNVKLRSDNTSGYKSVSFDRESGRWKASIMFGGKLRNLGRYPTKQLAAKAYNKAAKKHFGRFARLNPV